MLGTMKKYITDQRNTPLLFMLALLIVCSGCSYGASLLNKIPTNSIKVKVINENGEPITGAQVMASNGRKTATNTKGVAEVSFGTVGVYNVSVIVDNHMPSNFVVTMPVDDGETFKRRVALVPTFSRLRYGTMGMYRFIYNYMFSSFGYSLNIQPYQETEWTAWKMFSQDGNNMVMKKAFLKINDDGEEWWRVMMIPEGNEKPSYIAEVLFTKDHTRILRIREKIEDHDVKEKPVTKGWYTKPIELTDESIQGAVTKENVSVDVPAGTFQADKLSFGPTPATSLVIWKTASVPGGVVKYKTTSDDETLFQYKLIDYGSGADTMLNSY